jgi:hypothetical protein
MTSYAPPYTSRLRLKYRVQGTNHTMQARFPGPISGSGLTDCMAALHSFLVALQPAMFEDWTPISAAAADINSNIFLPVTNTIAPVGEVGILTREEEEIAYCATFVARSTGGNPMQLRVFGLAANTLETAGGVDFRVTFGESADVEAAVGILNLNSTAILGNDGNPLIWYPYANVKPNDEWVGKVRG